MRRALAIAITILFGWTLAAPLLVADAASSLPQCCRRNGSHHCMNGMQEPGARTLSSIAPKCPSFPKATAAPSTHGFAGAGESSAGVALYASPASAPQTEARYRLSCARSRQKRGPPVDLL